MLRSPRRLGWRHGTFPAGAGAYSGRLARARRSADGLSLSDMPGDVRPLHSGDRLLAARRRPRRVRASSRGAGERGGRLRLRPVREPQQTGIAARGALARPRGGVRTCSPPLRGKAGAVLLLRRTDRHRRAEVRAVVGGAEKQERRSSVRRLLLQLPRRLRPRGEARAPYSRRLLRAERMERRAADVRRAKKTARSHEDGSCSGVLARYGTPGKRGDHGQSKKYRHISRTAGKDEPGAASGGGRARRDRGVREKRTRSSTPMRTE